MFETIFASTATADSVITIPNLFIALAAAFVSGLLMSLVYIKTRSEKIPSQSFTLTLVMLPAVITVIIMLVGNNVARAFSLAGAFSIIRFRSAPGDPEDITYVLFTMAVGLACGMGFIVYGALVAAILCISIITLTFFKFGKPHGTSKILKITIPEDLDFQNAFDSVMEKYTLSNKLIKVKTTDLGSLYELVYSVTTKNESNEKAFIDDLRCRNGNLNITLVLDAPSGELQGGF